MPRFANKLCRLRVVLSEENRTAIFPSRFLLSASPAANKDESFELKPEVRVSVFLCSFLAIHVCQVCTYILRMLLCIGGRILARLVRVKAHAEHEAAEHD